jgi:hypothetical protein
LRWEIERPRIADRRDVLQSAPIHRAVEMRNALMQTIETTS